MRPRLRFWRKEPTWHGDWAQPAPQTRPVTTFSLAGRVSELELIRFAAEATNADGVGRLLHYDAEPKR